MRNASRRGFLARILVIASALVLAPVSAVFAAEPVTVFAAASLKDVLGTIAEDWKTETGGTVVLSFAASSALAKQIEEGAPADLFISADLKWMDYLAKADQLVADTRTDLLGNRIVLVAPAEATTTVHIEKGFPLAEMLGDGHLAMGNTDAVPAGVYGKAALEALGVWDGVKGKVAQAENVRAALLLVSRQEAPLGIVYETDAKADPKVGILDRFPEDSHPPIIYPAAVLKQAKGPEAKEFLAYLQSAKAHAVFTDAGFTVLSKTN